MSGLRGSHHVDSLALWAGPRTPKLFSSGTTLCSHDTHKEDCRSLAVQDSDSLIRGRLLCTDVACKIYAVSIFIFLYRCKYPHENFFRLLCARALEMVVTLYCSIGIKVKYLGPSRNDHNDAGQTGTDECKHAELGA